MEIQVNTVSVKVMRSHDYCHFEVSLSASLDPQLRPDLIDLHADSLRKTAARLADKAVEQYKVAKLNLELVESDANDLVNAGYSAASASRTPESERTPELKAIIKHAADLAHRNRPRYSYQDDWSESDYTDDEGEY